MNKLFIRKVIEIDSPLFPTGINTREIQVIGEEYVSMKCEFIIYCTINKLPFDEIAFNSFMVFIHYYMNL